MFNVLYLAKLKNTRSLCYNYFSALRKNNRIDFIESSVPLF